MHLVKVRKFVREFYLGKCEPSSYDVQQRAWPAPDTFLASRPSTRLLVTLNQRRVAWDIATDHGCLEHPKRLSRLLR